MRAASAKGRNEGKQILVDMTGLQQMLSAGRKTAYDIGTAAQARVDVGRRVLWNVKKVQEYVDSISF